MGARVARRAPREGGRGLDAVDSPAANQAQFDALTLAPALETLGDLHHERGDRARAWDYYLRFAGLWAGADAELQARVRRARERAGEG